MNSLGGDSVNINVDRQTDDILLLYSDCILSKNVEHNYLSVLRYDQKN